MTVKKIEVAFIPVEYKMDKLGYFNCEHIDADIEVIEYWYCGDTFSGPYRDCSEVPEEVCTSCQARWDKHEERWIEQW
jgi:hypothetical protein